MENAQNPLLKFESVWKFVRREATIGGVLCWTGETETIELESWNVKRNKIGQKWIHENFSGIN